MKQTYYKTCPNCGAHLDPGELCDCSVYEQQQEGGKKALEYDGSSKGSPAQVSARMERPQRRQATGIHGALLGA